MGLRGSRICGGGAGAGHHWVALMGLWHDKHGGSGAGEGEGREEGGKGKYWERWEEGSERGEEDSGRGPGATERVRVVRNLEKGGGARRKEEGGRRMGDLGGRMEDGGRRKEDGRFRMEDAGWRFVVVVVDGAAV